LHRPSAHLFPARSLRVNGRPVSIESWDPDQPLLYALRGPLSLQGDKPGCGLEQCGACTVIVEALEAAGIRG